MQHSVSVCVGRIWKWNFVLFMLDMWLQLLNSLRSLVIFYASSCATGEGEVWTADRLVLYSKVMWLHIVLLEEAGIYVKMTLSGWQHVLLQSLHVPFSVKGDMMVAHAMGLTPLHTITEAGFALALVTIWTVHFLLSLKDTTSMISKKCELIRPKEAFAFFCSRLGEVRSNSGCCWYVACTSQGVPCFCRCSN